MGGERDIPGFYHIRRGLAGGQISRTPIWAINLFAANYPPAFPQRTLARRRPTRFHARIITFAPPDRRTPAGNPNR